MLLIVGVGEFQADVISRAIEDVKVPDGLVVAVVVLSVDLSVVADVEDVMIVEVADVVFSINKSTHHKYDQSTSLSDCNQADNLPIMMHISVSATFITYTTMIFSPFHDLFHASSGHNS